MNACGVLLQPFLPGRAARLLKACGVPPEQRTLEHAEAFRADARVTGVEKVLLFPTPQLAAGPQARLPQA